MAGSLKKSGQEKSAVRKAQNARYRASKLAQGLVSVTVFVPAEALERVKGCRKVGLVVADDDVPALVVKCGRDGSVYRWEVIQRQGQLMEK